ncbi:MAG: hypothetical protein BGP03_01680 [Pseudonocardia sp. 73-21]|nr:MAG: hypothetical protein BGP03_01680 [Pseudonocardia sp. 73-21]
MTSSTVGARLAAHDQRFGAESAGSGRKRAELLIMQLAATAADLTPRHARDTPLMELVGQPVEPSHEHRHDRRHERERVAV